MASLGDMFPHRWSPQELQEKYPAGVQFPGIITNVRNGHAVSTEGFEYEGLFLDGVHEGKKFTVALRSTHVNELLVPALEALEIQKDGTGENGQPDYTVEGLRKELVGKEFLFELKYPRFERSNPRHIPVVINGTGRVKGKKGKSS